MAKIDETRQLRWYLTAPNTICRFDADQRDEAKIALVSVLVSKAWIVDDRLWELIECCRRGRNDRRGRVRCRIGCACRASCCAAYLDRLGRSAPGARLRLRDDLLAQVAALDRCGRVRPGPPNPAGETQRGKPDRLVSSGDGRQSHRREKGGAGTGPSPVDRGKPGSEHHLICDDNGTPINVLTSGANVPTSTVPSTCSIATRPSPADQDGPGAASPPC